MNDKDPESAHDVKSPGSEPEQKPNRKMRRKQEKFIAQEKKANNAKKGKSLTKSEMITIARQRQGLPPLEPKKKVLPQEKVTEEQAIQEKVTEEQAVQEIVTIENVEKTQ